MMRGLARWVKGGQQVVFISTLTRLLAPFPIVTSVMSWTAQADKKVG